MAVYKVGSFTKQNTTGTQAITGVGFTPKAIVFWTSGSNQASGTWRGSIGQSIGFTSGPTESFSVAGSSEDAVSTSDTVRGIAARAIAITNMLGGTTFQPEADLDSFDADGFTLDWIDAGSSPTHDDIEIMFLAIGGDDVAAKVVNWTSPTSTGNKAVTGVGFTPDLVLHVGSDLLAGVGNSATQHNVGFGAMDSAGGQWTNAVSARDNLVTSDTNRYQRTDKCIATIFSSSLTEEAEYVSMDADGFTTNFTTTHSNAYPFISLCLSGVDAKVGNFAKTTDAAPASQAITGVGFQSAAVMLSSTTGTPSTAVNSTAFWHLGGADGTNERTTGQVDLDGAPTTNAESFWKDDKALAIAGGVGSLFAEADLTSFDADGFTLNWTTNGGSSYEVLYLSLGAGNAPPNAPAIDVPDVNAIADLAAPLEVAWTPIDDPDGDVQAGYALKRQRITLDVSNGLTYAAEEWWDGAAWVASETEVASATESVTLPADWDGISHETYRLAVALSDGTDLGAYSDWVVINPYEWWNGTSWVAMSETFRTTSNTEVAITEQDLKGGHEYLWSVRTKDAAGETGPYAAFATFSVSAFERFGSIFI